MDEVFIQKCIDLAAKGRLSVAPNPMVGCVFVKDNRIVSRGFHQRFGEAHAEVNAYNNLPSGVHPKDCEVYVNLEPCSHHGKTPPCVDLLCEIKPKRVIIGAVDPNPLVAGNGIKKLKEAKIEVKTGVLESACKQLNKFFYKAHSMQLPFITLKWAETADGFIARIPSDDRSPKISDSKNDPFVHHLRAEHQSILVGSKTINRDKPQLNVRFTEGPNPIKVVLSPGLRVNVELDLFKAGKTLIYNNRQSFRKGAIEFVSLEDCKISTILKDLFEKGIHSVLVEGGAQTLNTFIAQNLWDETIVIRSRSKWFEGVDAPKLACKPVHVNQSFNDTITFYSNI